MTPAEETNERNACDEWFHEHDAGWFKDRVLRVIDERIGFEPCEFCAQPNTCTEAGGCDRGEK